MRVLVVLPDPVESGIIRQRCATLVAQGHEVAICYALASQITLQKELDAQRKITAALRQALDGSAEAIPVFVVAGEDANGVADCARAWGAAEVKV